jgi:hypothetical protein
VLLLLLLQVVDLEKAWVWEYEPSSHEFRCVAGLRRGGETQQQQQQQHGKYEPTALSSSGCGSMSPAAMSLAAWVGWGGETQQQQQQPQHCGSTNQEP